MMILNCILRTVSYKRNFPVSKNSFNILRSFSNDRTSSRYEVRTIPALTDNYMYLLIDKIEKWAFAVDPVEPDKILKCAEIEGVKLQAVLTTHHHFDHAGGNAKISSKIKNIPIFGGDDRIEALTTKLSHNEVFQVDKTNIRTLHTPCHTSGHVCYFIQSDEPICFTGDTLFIAGCGRFFEGSAEQMHKSLNILSSLPLNTKIYCGHEYTLSNLKFALTVEPNNAAILKRLQSAEDSLKNMKPTVPSTIKDELAFNPFLRVHEEAIKNFTQQTEPAAVIKKLRELKNNFVS